MAKLTRLHQQPLEMLSCGVDVELCSRLFYQGACGHYHDVCVAGEVADECCELGVFDLPYTASKATGIKTVLISTSSKFNVYPR